MPTTDSDLGLFCQFWYKNKRNSKDLGMSTVPARNFTYIVRNPLERKFNGELRDLVSEEYFFSHATSYEKIRSNADKIFCRQVTTLP